MGAKALNLGACMNFGTDGIRGRAGSEMTAAAVKLGNALGQGGRVIYIGRDTRASGITLLSALTAGIIRAGGKAVDLGIMPTAGVAYAVAKSQDADYGVVISASHNPEEYNGLKVFDGSGYKLGDKREQAVSKAMEGELRGNYDGIACIDDKCLNEYINHLVAAGVDLGGMRVLLDCANGAAYDIAPKVFKALNAQVVTVGADKDGKINDNCGSTYAGSLKDRVKDIDWDIAFTFDGDSDRLIAVDERGGIIDGDRIIYYIAMRWAAENKLNPMRAVGTILSNTGTQKAFENSGIAFERSNVGDKYVLEKMQSTGAIIGGEQSGHIIMTPYATTGDGILSAVVFASLLKQHNDIQISKLKDSQSKYDEGLIVKASKAGNYELYPQISKDVAVNNKQKVIESKQLVSAKNAWSERLAGGRVLVRASGTEPKIRIMAECLDIDIAEKCVEDIRRICETLNK